MLWLLLKTIGLVYVVRRIRTVLQARSFGPDVVKIYPFLSPMHPLGFIFPDLRFFRVVGFHWKERASLYEGNALRTIVFVPLLMGEPFVFTGNIDAFYNNLALNSDWIKADNPALREFGDNVVTSIGQTWKRHRRITAPAFNQDTYQNVWDTTAWVYREMMDKNGWRGVAETSTFNINEATHKVAIFLVTIVGFNIPMNWTEPKRNADGRLSTQSMILTIAGSLMQRGLLPRWVFKLPFQKFREMEEAFSTFEEFMVARIEARETEIERLRATGSDEELGETLKDVFGRLVHARMADGKSSMSDREIIGNCFAFAFAGHETSANALAALLGLLALYPDEQEWVYKSIVDTVGDKEMTFEDYDHLDGVLACLYEGLRLFPVAWLLAQVSGQDTVLSLSMANENGKKSVPVPAGTMCLIDTVGQAYDPSMFPDPEAFKPSRWQSVKTIDPTEGTKSSLIAEEDRDLHPATTLQGFTGFSYGPRTCLGHKFAKVESVAFLTFLLRDWKIVPVMKKNETVLQWRERVLKPSFGQALLIGEVPVRLIRRK